jgi:hypothetical protein
MKTRKEKIDYLVKNTLPLPSSAPYSFLEYLNKRLEMNTLSHKELDEFIDYCNQTNGGCLLTAIFSNN